MEPTERVTNLNYLNELSKGDAAFINEMVNIFLSENPEEVRVLETAMQEGDYDTLRSMSHHMKSTITFVGLDLIIGTELTDIERLAVQKSDLETIKALFAIVKTNCAKAFEELSSQTL